VAGTLALPSFLPPALADDEPARTLLKTGAQLLDTPLDAAGLYKPGIIEDWVSTEPLGESVVRKIGFGKTEFVRVIETSTGIYSSDGLSDPHIRYPGLHEGAAPATATAYGLPGLVGLWDGTRWLLQTGFSAGSFVNIVPFGGGETILSEDGACFVLADDSIYC
jgi:hypothetical protein